ncbi:MAG: extracellular solute-binding protein [Rhodospirillales bacterium]|nr:extracellular solute-binding protein [Rhodospirillales bacterium]
MNRMILTVLAALALIPAVGAQPRAQTLDELAKKAATAGPVAWYESSPQNQIEPVIAAFAKRYPGIKVEYVRDPGGNALVGRVVQEAQSGTKGADLISTGPLFITPLAKRNLLENVDWKALGVEAKLAPVPYAVTISSAVYVLLYNTNLVSDADAPKTWEDLLNPRWKDKLGTWIRGEPLASLAYAWGEEKTVDYTKKLSAQKPFLFKSTFPLAQQVAAGEVHVALGLYHSAMVPIKKGAPLKLNLPSPVSYTSIMVAVTKSGGNPAGAKVLAAWLASPEGARIYEEATSRGNPLLAATDTAKMLAGRTLTEFPIEQTETSLRIVETLNGILADGGKAAD